jgi:hypothetical protein
MCDMHECMRGRSPLAATGHLLVLMGHRSCVRGVRERMCVCALVRVVLDEAHSIKNRKTEAARAAFALHAERRWVLSGTPVQNQLEVCALFLRATVRGGGGGGGGGDGGDSAREDVQICFHTRSFHVTSHLTSNIVPLVHTPFLSFFFRSISLSLSLPPFFSGLVFPVSLFTIGTLGGLAMVEAARCTSLRTQRSHFICVFFVLLSSGELLCVCLLNSKSRYLVMQLSNFNHNNRGHNGFLSPHSRPAYMSIPSIALQFTNFSMCVSSA